MKKSLIAVMAIGSLMLASCSTIRKTSTSIEIPTSIISESTADLKVSQEKITYKYIPNRPVRRSGEKNVIKAAVAEALKANGDADVLVAMQYEIKTKKGFFGQKTIKYVIVKGYPAKYTNIKPMDPPQYIIMNGSLMPCNGVRPARNSK